MAWWKYKVGVPRINMGGEKKKQKVDEVGWLGGGGLFFCLLLSVSTHRQGSKKEGKRRKNGEIEEGKEQHYHHDRGPWLGMAGQ